jgi:hypothetical protein
MPYLQNKAQSLHHFQPRGLDKWLCNFPLYRQKVADLSSEYHWRRRLFSATPTANGQLINGGQPAFPFLCCVAPQRKFPPAFRWRFVGMTSQGVGKVRWRGDLVMILKSGHIFWNKVIFEVLGVFLGWWLWKGGIRFLVKIGLYFGWLDKKTGATFGGTLSSYQVNQMGFYFHQKP